MVGQAIKLARHEAFIFGMGVRSEVVPQVNVVNVQLDSTTAQRMAELYLARHAQAAALPAPKGESPDDERAAG